MALWSLGLAATLPVFISWPQLESTYGIVFRNVAGASASALVIVFALTAANRRKAIALAAASVTAISSATPGPLHGGAIAGWVGLALLGIVLVEIVKQNVAVLRALSTNDPCFRRNVAKAIFAWSPMLLFAGAGMCVHHLLKTAAEELTYMATPVDRYCAAQPAPVSCESISGGTRPTPLRDEASLQHKWTGAVSARQQAVLAYIRSQYEAIGIPDAAFATPQALAPAIAKLNILTDPYSVLTLPRDGPVLLADLQNSDPETQRLNRNIADWNARMGETTTEWVSTGKFGSAASDHAEKMIQRSFPLSPIFRAAIAEAQRQIEARAKVLIAQSRVLVVSADQAKGLLVHQLTTGLAQVPQLAVEPAMIAKTPADVLAARAALASRAVQRLAALDANASNIVTTAAPLVRAAEAAKVPGVPSLKDQVRALNVVPLCVNADFNARQAMKSVHPHKTLPGSAFDCATTLAQVDGKLQPIGLRASIDRSIQQWHDQRVVDAEAETRHALAAVASGADEGRDSLNRIAATVPLTIHIRRWECGFDSIKGALGCVANPIAAAGEEYYADQRRSAGSAVSAEVNEGHQQGFKAALPVLMARDRARHDIDRATEDLRSTVQRVQAGVDWISLALSCILVIVLIKSLMYALALKLFAEGGASAVMLDRTAPVLGKSPRVASNTDLAARALEFPDLSSSHRLVNRPLLRNQEQRNALIPPWPGGSVIARLLHGRYYRYNVGGPAKPEEPDQAVTWVASSGQWIADWLVQPGETIAFNYRHFEGASEHIELHSFISLRLDTMLFGQLIFPLASVPVDRPPAHLLLSAKVLDPDAVAIDSIQGANVESIVAWNVRTAFQARLNKRSGAMFVDPVVLTWQRAEPPLGRVLVDSTPIPVYFTGLWRFALRALSPF